MRLGPEIGLQNFLKQKRKLLKRLKRKQKESKISSKIFIKIIHFQSICDIALTHFLRRTTPDKDIRRKRITGKILLKLP
jgi:hypothetical protein